ncbi:MAG: N-acetylmuramoyl-L-alanine amidase [Deltaproteobacteria bacterium]|nr:N-acetylmuramoyl-L-alanine amidase [Deltaproteobacteria bacterium]
MALLALVDTAWAATIEQFSLRHTGHAVEVEFAVQGTTPRWHLHTHGQELRLDLDHSRVAAFAEPVSWPVFFPLAQVSMRDFGGGRVQLVIRVRGRVDYAIAQMPHELVVRIAPSGRAADLGFKEFPSEEGTEIHEAERGPVNQLDSTHVRGKPLSYNPSQMVTDDGRQRMPAQSMKVTNLLTGAEAAVSSPDPVLAANPFRPPPLASRREPVYGQQTVAQDVQPVAQHVTAGPWGGEDRARPLVAIDAGHGGFDPGTESAGGIAEKNVALAIARRLAAALDARGVDAELTRNDDQFISLEQRTQLANHAHADLFVSIHLNSSPNWNTSGIETYYLNNTTDRATIRLARIENGGDYSAAGHSNLNYILTNLRQDYKAHESSSLARMIEAEAAASVSTTLGITVNALGAKMGPFYVLVGAEMPSILIECGFLSNPREAQLLLQSGYQEALANGIALAITHYFHADGAVGNL